MRIGPATIMTLFIATAATGGCQLWQGPLLSAPYGTSDLAARHNKAGIQAYKQEQWNRAKEQFEVAVTIAPSLAEGHYNLGMVLYRQGKDAEAETHFLKAAALAPENEMIQSAPPFTKAEAPSRSGGYQGMSDGHSHSH
ncbi:MAG: tetratricopeptide repeat protein [Nitrospira sp.]